MAGWRIGFAVGNKTPVSALARIKSYHDYGTFTLLSGALMPPPGRRSAVRARWMPQQSIKRRRDVLGEGAA